MFETILKVVIFLATMASLLAVTLYQDFTLFILATVGGCLYILFMPQLTSFLSVNFLYNKPLQVPTKDLYNEKRFKTYPSPVTNTWYHFCDSDELKNGQVMEYRALDRVFVLWRDSNGKPVCQDAFCIHQGANLGHGGKVIDNCLQCPFHNWKFSSDGTIIEIPYLKTSKSCDNIKKKQKTYHCMDYCGWLLVYFHVENKNPEFYPPTFISNQLKTENWKLHIKYDVGYYHFSPIDIVDQAGDHAHFHTLHSEFMFPWTKISFPEWLRYIFPIAISHTCNTYRGDDKEWIEEVKKINFGTVDPYLLVFTDLAGLTWKGRLLRSTLSQTVETYIGPALIVFHIPFTLGTMKVFLSVTPVDGGSVVRVRTFVDTKVAQSWILKCVAYLLAGISASALSADADILEHKIRLRKPLIQPFDGPYNRVNAWLKQFYSEYSYHNGGSNAEPYKNDW